MHMVINIPEEFKEIIDGENYLSIFHSVEGKAMLIYIIRNGIPLPKGHGRLIDANDLRMYEFRIPHDRYEDYKVVSSYDIVTAPTIIEADEEVNQ